MKSDCLPGDGVFLTDLISAPPAINLKPVSGGVEIAVLYITRATERYEMRSSLYQAAMITNSNNTHWIGNLMTVEITKGELARNGKLASRWF